MSRVGNLSSKQRVHFHAYFFKPIQDGEGPKRPPTSFSPATSTNVEISPHNFLTFSFNPFVTLV